MTANSIPAHIRWAVEKLDLRPSDHVLEIGCGRGLAIPLVSNRLGRGTLTAIDRSPTMIAAARKQKAVGLASDRVRFHVMALADADTLERRFTRIFAINVNLFWLDPAQELLIVKRLLRRNGTFALFYRPPSLAQLRRLTRKLADNLASGGFFIDQMIDDDASGSLCVVARPAKGLRMTRRLRT